MIWRTGRKVGRTIYAQIGAEPSDADVLIGVMDTTELAAEVVRAHRLIHHDEATVERMADVMMGILIENEGVFVGDLAKLLARAALAVAQGDEDG